MADGELRVAPGAPAPVWVPFQPAAGHGAGLAGGKLPFAEGYLHEMRTHVTNR